VGGAEDVEGSGAKGVAAECRSRGRRERRMMEIE
jgi:hypothetical protein